MSVGAVVDGNDVAGPGPGAAAPAPVVPAVAPPPATPGMPQMPGVPQVPAGPKGPNFDPTGTVPVAGSPADPNHPAQQAPASPPPDMEEAVRRRYVADQYAADIDQQIADNAQEQADNATQASQRRADLEKAQLAETQAEENRQREGLARAQAERDNLRQNVKDFRFHSFWDTRSTAQTILANIGVILGSASYGENHVNRAAQTIDNAISREWDAQKADLDQRMQLAQEAGANERELRLQYDYESGKLKLRQEAQLHALADEMDALAARSKNKAGVLQAQKLAADARSLAEAHGIEGVKDIASAHSQKLKDAETQAATERALAQANRAARRGPGGAGGKERLKEEKQAFDDTKKELSDVEKEAKGSGASGGPKTRYQTAGAMLERLDAVTAKMKAAEATKDPAKIKAAREELANETIKATEGAGPLLSGGKTTRFGGRIIEDSKTLHDHAVEAFGKFFNSKQAGDSFVRELRQFASDSKAEARADLEQLRKASVDRALGEGGVANTPRSKAHYMRSINSALGLEDEVAPGGTPALTPAQQRAMAGGGFKVLQ